MTGRVTLDGITDEAATLLALKPFGDGYAVLAIAFGMLAWFYVTTDTLAPVLFPDATTP